METNEKATTLEELVNSKEYKKSDYEILQIDDKYILKDLKLNEYASLNSEGTRWIETEPVKNYCIGESDQVIRAFYREVGFIEKKLKEAEPLVFKKIGEKEAELKVLNISDYKSKLMEGLE